MLQGPARLAASCGHGTGPHASQLKVLQQRLLRAHVNADSIVTYFFWFFWFEFLHCSIEIPKPNYLPDALNLSQALAERWSCHLGFLIPTWKALIRRGPNLGAVDHT